MGDSVRGRVRAMGEQFLLSDREVDVLALYAMGYTQKKVAEELFITPATAHTHIKPLHRTRFSRTMRATRRTCRAPTESEGP